jgi:hypothetical protein
VKIRNWLFALIGLGLASGAIQPAAASTISFDVTFGASDFSSVFSSGVPVPAPFVLGHFGVTFDPTADVANSSNATLDFIDPIALAFPLAFDYTLSNDTLMVGGSNSGASGVAGGTNDFMLSILNFTSGSPVLAFLYYGQASILTDIYGSTTGLVHVKQVASPPVATTPIPAALPLFISALGGMGYLGWRRRKSAAA